MDNKGIGLVKLQVKNLGITKNINVDLVKGVNIFQGDNGAGKSTILNSIKYALQGKKQIPADIIRHGFNNEGKSFRSEVVLKTTDFEVHLEIYKGKDGKEKHKLCVKKDGFVKDAPIEFLNQLSKEWNDPKVLSEMSSSDLGSILMKYAKIDLSSFDSKIENLKSNQSFLRRTIKELGVEQEIEKTEPVDITTLMSDLNIIQENNRKLATQRAEKKEIEKEVSIIQSDITNQNSIIRDLQNRLEQEKTKLSKLTKLGIAKTREIEISPTIPEDEDESEIKDKVLNANATNLKAQDYKDFISWKEKLEKNNSEFEDNKEAIKKLEQDKINAVKNASLPLPELKLVDKKAMYKEFLWENLSETERLIIASKIIVETTPPEAIRYMVIHQGESILSDRRNLLDTFLKENNYTCL